MRTNPEHFRSRPMSEVLSEERFAQVVKRVQTAFIGMKPMMNALPLGNPGWKPFGDLVR